MKISNIETFLNFNDNHEAWYVCKHCHHEYDLRKDWKCPNCGAFPDKQ